MSTTAVKERPIIFTAPNVRAILAGTKTQTRRLVKSPHPNWVVEDDGAGGPVWPGFENQHGEWCDIPCPYGAVGDRLWVRETWAVRSWDEDGNVQLFYKSDPPDKYWATPVLADGADMERAAEWIESDRPWGKKGKWRPSIHMPRWASRITLEIAGVRVERLQEISEADAQAEGAPYADNPDHDPEDPCDDPPQTYRAGFIELWHAIHKPDGPHGWEANPAVFVIQFKRVETGATR